MITWNIKNLRVGARLTQKELAQKLEVSQALISEWEKQNRVPAAYREAFNAAVGLSDTVDHRELEMFGSEENAENFQAIVKFILEHNWTSEEGDISERLESGTSFLVSDLHEARLSKDRRVLPDVPKIPEGEDFELSDVQADYLPRRLYFEALPEFMRRFAAVSALLDDGPMNELTPEDDYWDEFASVSYGVTPLIWDRLIYEGAFWDLDNDGDADGMYLRSHWFEYRREVWMNMLVSLWRHTGKATWDPLQIIGALAGDSRSSVGFDSPGKRIERGRSPDVYIASIQQELADMRQILARIEGQLKTPEVSPDPDTAESKEGIIQNGSRKGNEK